MLTSKTSHERLFLEELLLHLPEIPSENVFRGFGAANRFGIQAWDLPANQRSQFGDLRIESPTATIIVEVESGGGVTNLAKYWPLLAERSLEQRFVLVHVFAVNSDGDYMAHRRLWAYLVERMRLDLEERCIVRWPQDWYAALFTYRPGGPLDEISKFIRAVHAGKA